nr:PREDICTED: facilitated trehalose transporter Tret1-like [Bemisia tabaci]
MYYTIDFVERLGTTYDPLTVSIIISIARIIANSTLGIYFTAFVGRRFSTALSAILMTVAFVGAGTYEYLYRDTPVGQRPHEWLPITLVIVNIVSSIIAVTPLPWLMSGEVFPLRVRGSMSGVSLALGAGMMFVFIKAYEVAMRALQIWGMLFVYAAASFVTIFFGAFVLPETQGKTLWEIEQGFLPKKRRVGSTGK